LLFAAVGPGLIAANADNDAGGITTYSLAGAQFGYNLLWVLVVITLALAVTQEMGARMGAVTGKGFGDLIRERFGARWAAFAIVVMLVANLSNNVAEFAGIAAALLIFHVSVYISVPISAIAVAFLVIKYDYRQVQRILLISSALYLAYVISGVLAHPDWHEALVKTFRPHIEFSAAYLTMCIGVIGTTITPWGQFFIQSYVVDKRLRADDLPYTQADVYVGSFFTDLIAFFIVIACAATIWIAHKPIIDAADAAMALKPLAGSFAAILFAVGLLNASLLGAVVLPLTSAYATCETFGWQAGINNTWKEAPVFFALFTAFIVLSALTVLIPGMPLIQIIFLSQVLNGALLPIILIFVLKLSTDKAVMGEYTNSRAFNFIAIITIIGLIVMTILLLATPILPNLLTAIGHIKL
jgi:NRAMP (natural resistance-associated macrophage protein)-like metal ion transporter